MTNISRRQLFKSLGLISVGLVTTPYIKAAPSKQKRKKEAVQQCDVLVVGGGTAGVIAAIQAGRLGKKTILIESGSQLGGTITTAGVSFPGLFHAWGKQIVGGIGWELVNESAQLNGDRLPDFSIIPNNTTIRHWRHQVSVNSAVYVLLAEEKCLEAGVEIRYYESPGSVEFSKNKWKVESVGKGQQTQIECKQLIDCTGNALMVSMAGLEVLKEAETQPGSLIFTLGGYDFSSLDLNRIPRQYHSLLRQNMFATSANDPVLHNFPPTVPYNYVYVPGADSTTAQTHTAANIEGRKRLLLLLREFKKLPGCENIRIESLQTETAIRETYRIRGLYEVTQEDYINGVNFDDAVSYSFYPVDLHQYGKRIHQEYLKEGVVAKIPLRSLIPQNSKNILVAGRSISSDRMANSALRVQASSMGMAQAAAVAASLAIDLNTTPALVPVQQVKAELKKQGAIVPE
jgi:hypothetical protein